MAESATRLHDKQLPNESVEYRQARNALLQKEQQLRAQLEEVAALRRSLPPGGELKEDYEFGEINFSDGAVSSVRFSELFNDKQDLLVYSYMYGPDWQEPCPSCTSVIDGINACSRHVRQQAEMVVIGNATPGQLHTIAIERGWSDLRLLSSVGNDYTRDYLAQPDESAESLLPVLNVFRKDDNGIRHFWASETLWTPLPGGHPRHVDIVWPLWGLLDLTRSGRHPTWGPSLRYSGVGPA